MEILYHDLKIEKAQNVFDELDDLKVFWASYCPSLRENRMKNQMLMHKRDSVKKKKSIKNSPKAWKNIWTEWSILEKCIPKIYAVQPSDVKFREYEEKSEKKKTQYSGVCVKYVILLTNISMKLNECIVQRRSY